MRGLSVTEIIEEVAVTLHMKVGKTWVYDQINAMEEANASTFSQMRKSNTAYINEVMTLKNHLDYYRQILMKVLKGPEFQHQLTIPQIMKITEFLYKIDETHFNMLKEMPKMFAWGGLKNGRGGPVYGSLDHDQSEKDISQFVTNLEQIPVPHDLEELQNQTENEKLGAHTQDPFIKKELPNQQTEN